MQMFEAGKLQALVGAEYALWICGRSTACLNAAPSANCGDCLMINAVNTERWRR